MSADNTMLVQQRGSEWHVWMALGEDGWDEPGGDSHHTFDDELSAHHYAHRVCEDQIVEYGVQVLPPVAGAEEET